MCISGGKAPPLVWVAASLWAMGMVNASDENSACKNGDDDEVVDTWISDGGFFALFLGVCAMFWGLAAVCEEYFVPALNVLCEELNVPDDVAGATFMAAGASSPEMFTAFIALFVDHSALGVGTVVGSEIFNHMIICAGSVMYSADGVLYLDKFIFSRDVGAYFLSLVLLVWALKGSPVAAVGNMFAAGAEDECLRVTIFHATGLLLLYACYVIVSGYFQAFLKRFDLEHDNSPLDGSSCGADGLRQSLLNMDTILEGDDENTLAGAPRLEPGKQRPGPADEEDPSLLNLLTTAMHSNAPQSSQLQAAGAPASSYSYRSHRLTGGGQSLRGGVRTHARDMSQQRSSFVKDQAMYSWRSSSFRGQSHLLRGDEDEDCEAGLMMRRSKAGVIGPAASRYHSLLRSLGSEASEDELGAMEISPQSLSGYLFLRSSFYNMHCCPALKAWRLRYFTVDRHGMHSRKCRESERCGPQVELIDLQTCREVEITDRARGLFQLHRLPTSEHERPLEFAATSLELLDEVVTRLASLIQQAQDRSADQQLQFNRKASVALDGEFHLGGAGELHCGLLDPPDVEFGSPRGMAETSWHYLIYPLKFLLHHSLPDVMLKGGRGKYVSCLFMSVAWLALLSYIMIKCCDGLGQWIGTSPIVMGLTLSAVGTSFPNLWSSMLVARQGLGNMAVSNAFGSNTFNICIALGLPWFTLALISGDPYEKMRDDGIVFMVLLLAAILVVFYVVVMVNSWRIKYWMSYYFVAVYIAVMVYAILHG